MESRPRLVFGDDGSPAADVVWLWILGHEWPRWRISVVTAHGPLERQPPPGRGRDLAPWEPTAARELIGHGPDTDVEFLEAYADPRAVLDSITDASLVAIGPRGKGLLKQLHIGSTAEWLLSAHRPLTPLVIVRSGRRTRRVLLCTDGSAHARRATETLAALPWVGDCRIDVFTVDDGRADVAAAAEQAQSILGPTGATLDRREASVVRGLVDVRGRIMDAVEDESPDLVVMGTRGRSTLLGLSVGSAARAVVHHASCSVLVARDVAAAGDET